jgi:hypothetical protein
MNIDNVKEMLAEIKQHAIDGDDELAHSCEDSLYIKLLEAISNGICDNHQECCTEALKSQKMDFARWCA